MSRADLLRPLVAALRGKQFKPTVILLASTLLMATWKWLGSPAYYRDHLSPRLALWHNPEVTAVAYGFLACLFLLGVIPALIVKMVFREKLADYGVQLGHRARTFRTFLACAPVVLLVACVASKGPAIVGYYESHKSAGASPCMFGFHACMYMAFYLGWEFHFRGFLQFGLQESLGQANAVLIQVLASALLHIGTPVSEMYAAVVVGILWGILAFRTRSLLSGLLQHALLGISLDWFIIYGT